MSVGYTTRRAGLWFDNCCTGGLFRPEVRYSTSDVHAVNFSQHGVVIEVGEQAAGARKDRDAVR